MKAGIRMLFAFVCMLPVAMVCLSTFNSYVVPRLKTSSVFVSAVAPPVQKPDGVEKPKRLFHVGRWVRHSDGDLGLIEEIGQGGTYRVRIEADAKDKQASWYEGDVWRPARPRAREWWRHVKTGIVFQPSEDWVSEDDVDLLFEPVNWGRG